MKFRSSRALISCFIVAAVLGMTFPLLAAPSTATVAPSSAGSTGAPGSTVGGGSPVAPGSRVDAGLPPALEAKTLEMSARLQVPYAVLVHGQVGLEHLYARRYREARESFERLEREHPTSAVGPLGRVMVAQSLMSENLDFSQEEAYTRAYRETLRRAEVALDRGEARAWNRFLRGCALAVNGIHQYRHDKVLSALQDGWSALQDLEEAQRIEPAFVDPVLGLGLYDYWRSSLARKYKYIPFVKDQRSEGLRKIQLARDQGFLAPTLARLALVYSYVDLGKTDKALNVTEELYRAYPNNVVNLQLLGQLYMRKRKYEQARNAYEQVLVADPRNVQVYYYLGQLEFRRGGDLERARAYFNHYVTGNPQDSFESVARVRLGDACWLLGDPQRAQQEWKLAAVANPDYWVAQQRVQGKRPRARIARPTPRVTATAEQGTPAP